MTRSRPRTRSGITLTEILISIMIMGVGLVSLATLFPLGLVRLRDAARNTRSTFLGETAVGDAGARALMSLQSFRFSWYFNYPGSAIPYGSFSPWSHDTDLALNPNFGVARSFGPGLPVAYDPLWWATVHQTSILQGLPLTPLNTEARFASGIGFVRLDPDGGQPSAWGLQRLTNFQPWLPTNYWPFTYPTPQYPIAPDVAGDAFTSRDDIVMQTLSGNGSALGVPKNQVNTTGMGSPVVPDLSSKQVMNDWTYSWMFTGRQSDVNDATIFDGDVVVFHNRPFALDNVGTPFGGTRQVAEGERVVEAIFGALGGGRTVVLRWPAGSPDPDVKVGSWIADVTYERTTTTVTNRFGLALPAQRCLWYQVAKRQNSEPAPMYAGDPGPYRQMVITLTNRVTAFTPLNPNTLEPLHVNVALVCPYVVNVFPKTFYIR